MSKLYSIPYESPIGTLLLGVSENVLHFVEYADSSKSATKIQSILTFTNSSLVESFSPYHKEVIFQLNEYFTGERTVFLLLCSFIGTEFQKSVWKCLQTITYGKTLSYKEQSLQMNKPLAIRAIASTNAKNCINIVVPCHRVIGGNGSLTGYSGGLWRKRWLLDFESEYSNTPQDQLNFL